MVSAALHRDMLESLLFAVALAVGLTPEFLPMIISVTLSQGAVHMARQKVIVKHLSAIQNFGSIDILCSDKTGTLTRGDMTLSKHIDPFGHPADRILLLGYLNSIHETGIKSPLDAAILKFHQPDIKAYRKIDEIPFDFERRCLSVVVEKEGQKLLITKGAPEAMLTHCTAYEAAGLQTPFDPGTKAQSLSVYQKLCADGFRVLAVGYRSVPDRNLYSAEDEKELVLVGFLAFLDPPLEDVAAVLQSLRRDGVRVKILTGDNELVTRHVCSEVGLDATRIVLGEELDRMSDPALTRVVQRTNVFARVSPRQKNRIILALKHRGHVVGFLGDGMNDAPSLHTADVGISVSTAVDAAKEAADIILLERSLGVLHNGIIEGRKAFGNVMKYLLMGTSSNFGNMFSMAAASYFLPFLPMLPIQILLNNFLYDLAQITIPTDNVDPTFVRKPHRWDVSLIRKFMVYIGPISSVYDFLTFGALLFLFHSSEPEFHTGWFVESLATQTLVLFVIRTAGNPLRSHPSRLLTVTILAVVLIGSLIPHSPIGPVLGFTPLPPAFLLLLVGLTGTYLMFVQWAKHHLMGEFLR
jgi:Mg2+-importing ATPase